MQGAPALPAKLPGGQAASAAGGRVGVGDGLGEGEKERKEPLVALGGTQVRLRRSLYESATVMAPLLSMVTPMG